MREGAKRIIEILQGRAVEAKLEFDEMIECAMVHKMVGHVYQASLTYGYSHLQERMLPLYVESVKEGLKQLYILKNLVQLFEEANIPFVVLKGFALEAQLGYSPYSRMASDIDVLIHEESVERVRESLIKQGYREVPVLDKGDDIQFIKSGVGVEIHYKLDKCYISREMQRRLLESRESVQIEEFTLPTLSLEGNILYTMMHGISHGFFALIWLYDFYRLIQTQQEDESKVYRGHEFQEYFETVQGLAYHMFEGRTMESHKKYIKKIEKNLNSLDFFSRNAIFSLKKNPNTWYNKVNRSCIPNWMILKGNRTKRVEYIKYLLGIKRGE